MSTKEKSAPRKPDLVLKALNKKTDQRSSRLGVAWMNLNDEGEVESIDVHLDICVVLTADPDLSYKLFPYRSKDAIS